MNKLSICNVCGQPRVDNIGHPDCIKLYNYVYSRKSRHAPLPAPLLNRVAALNSEWARKIVQSELDTAEVGAATAVCNICGCVGVYINIPDIDIAICKGCWGNLPAYIQGLIPRIKAITK